MELDGEAGFTWALRAHPAEGHRQDNSDPVDILEVSGDYPRNWACMCPHLSDLISEGNAGNLTPGSDEEMYYDTTLLNLRTLAANRCIKRSAEIGNSLGTIILFDGSNDVSCEDATADEIPYMIDPQCVVGGCDGDIPLPGTGGIPPATTSTGADTTAGDATAGGSDGGMHVYGVDSWSDVITITGTNTYKLDEEFVDDVLEDLTVFADDDIGIGNGVSALSHEGFEFETVGEDSLADALEFQADDIIWELNGDSMKSIDEVTEAFETLQLETVFTIKLDRGSTTITKTITLSNLSTYP